MTVEAASINNHIVYRDHIDTWRWYDAFGPNVVKWFFNGFQSVVSTTTAAGCTITQTNGTLVTADSTTGGAVKLTLGGATNDKVEIQSESEGFYFASRWPAYFGCKFQMVDADQTPTSAGFIIRDTDIAGGVADGIYFRIAATSAVFNLVLEQDSAESTTTVIAATADATDYQLEMFYDCTYVHVYLNGTLVASVAASDANFCNDEHLTATFAAQTAENSANHVTLYWARAIQIQAT